MRNITRYLFLLLVVFLFAVPKSVYAYTYGDPNQEDVAETFKLVVSKLAESDWNGALAAHKVRRSEIESHFGSAVAVTLDKNFESRNAEDVIANYKAVLVMNLDRRFTYAKKGIEDYAQTKLLLAKAKATFDTLKPFLESKLSSAKIAELEGKFDEALNAIGNPGLFGIGKNESDPAKLRESVDAIYAGVNGLFPYTAFKAEPVKETVKAPVKEPVKEQPVAGTGTVTKSKDGATKPANTSAAEKPAVSVKEPASTPKAEVTENQSPAAEKAENEAGPALDAEGTDVTPADKNKEQTVAAEAPVEEAAAPTIETHTTTAVEPDPEPAAAENTEAAVEQPIAAEASEEAEAAVALEDHAPMERTDKTNPAVTLGVIGAVIVFGGAMACWARRKGIF